MYSSQNTDNLLKLAYYHHIWPPYTITLNQLNEGIDVANKLVLEIYIRIV